MNKPDFANAEPGHIYAGHPTEAGIYRVLSRGHQVIRCHCLWTGRGNANSSWPGTDRNHYIDAVERLGWRWPTPEELDLTFEKGLIAREEMFELYQRGHVYGIGTRKLVAA